MAKPTVRFYIETMLETEASAFGRSFMQHLLDEDPRLAPEVVSTSERFKDPFVDLDHFLEHWWAIRAKSYSDGKFRSESFWGPLWKRKSALASRGQIHHGLINVKGQHIPSSLRFECRWNKSVDFNHLFGRWVELARPEAAMLHLFTDAEKPLLDSSEGGFFYSGSFGGPAMPGIANIGWAMAYGGGYAAEVDVDRLRAAGFPVEVINDVIVVRVTEKLSDVVDDFAFFSRRRAEMKALFRDGLFWITEEPPLP